MRNLRNEKNKRIYTIFSLVIAMMMVLSSVAPIFATGDAPASDAGQTPAAAETNNQEGTDSTDPAATDEGTQNNEGTDPSDDGTSSDAENPEATEPQTEGEGETEGEAEATTPEATETPAAAPAQAPKLLNNAPLKAPANEESEPESYGIPKDFKEQIQAVDVQRMGNTQTSWSNVDDDNPVQTGDDVKFTITFTLPTGYLYRDPGPTNTITYNVTPPIGEIFPEKGIVPNDAGRPLGYYTITPNSEGGSPTGTITIVFTDEAVRANRTSRLDKGRVSFTSSVDSWEGEEGGVVDVPIGGDVGDVEIIIQPQDAVGDIKIVKKTTNSVNKATGELVSHSMDITTTSGTKTNVIVTDTMVEEVIKGDGNFKVTKTTPAQVDPETGEETSPASTTEVTPISLKNEKDSTTFNDSDGNHDYGFEMELPPLGAGEKYTITYDAYYPKLVNGSKTLKNTAIAKSTDEKDKLLISSSTTTNTLSDKPLDKTGELIVEGEGTNVQFFIEWTVIINPNKVDIGKWSLKDTGLYNDEVTNLTAKDVKLIKDAQKQDDGTYTGTEIALASEIVLDGTQTLYTFPDGDKSNYVLQYRTPMNFDDTNYKAKNTIMMDPPQGNQDNSGNNPSSTSPGVEGIITDKEHENIEIDLSDPKNPKALITWTMTIDTKAAPIPVDSVFEDVLGAKQKLEKSQDELKALITQAFEDQGCTIEWIDQEESKKETQFKFKITSGVAVGKKITFSYKSVIQDFDPASQYTYTNGATIKNPSDETIANPTDSVVYKPMINKYDSSSGKTTGTDRTTTHKVGDSYVTYKENKQTIKWGFDVNMPASYYEEPSSINEYVIIRDELPEGLVPKYLAFGSEEFTEIENATEANPSEIEKNLEDWIATEQDVTNGYAKNVGDKISDAAEFKLQAWTEKDNGKYTVFVKIPKAAIQYYKNKTHEYKIYAEIPADWNWGTNDKGVKQSSFENNVFLIPDSSDVSKSVVDSKHTQVIIYDENEKAIIKGHEYDKSKDERLVPYRIIVNEEEKDLLPDGDTLDFKDTLTATYPYGVSVTLVPESFKAYIVDKDSIEYKKISGKHDVVDSSKVKRLKDITDSVGFNHEAGKKSGDDWVITAKLPDNKAILIQYDYHISGYTTGRERVGLKNTSEISGVANDSNNDEWSDEIAVQKSDSGIEIMRVTLEKVDKANGNKALAGAEFDFYVYDGTDYISIGKMVTNEDGQLVLDTGHIQEAGGAEIEFNYNTAYRLIEVRPPKGYKVDPTPIDFYVMDRDDPVSDYAEEEFIPDDFDGYLLGTDSFLYFDNVQAHPKFKVEKVAATDKVELGQIIEYTIKATNTSKDDAYDCTIVDILGKGLEYVDDDSEGTNDGQITKWKKDIMAGETVTIKFYARAVKEVKGGFVNTAYVEYDDVEGETTSEKVLAEVELDDEDEKADDKKDDKTDDSGNVKGTDTGDYTNMYIYVTLMAIAVIAIAYVYMRRRRDN